MQIRDRQSAERWSNQQTLTVQRAFATRCALRGLPGLAFEEPERAERLIIAAMRATLLLAVAVAGPTTRLGHAVEKAGSDAVARSAKLVGQSNFTLTSAASKEAFRPSSSAIASANSAASAEASCKGEPGLAYKTTLLASSWDAGRIAPPDSPHPSSTNVFLAPLWPVEDRHGDGVSEPQGLSEGYVRLSEMFESAPETWEFWARWLEGMRKGEPLPWALQEQVALIGKDDDFKIWEEGPAAIAAEIKKIEARHIAGLLREEIALSEDNKLIVVPAEIRDPRHLGHLLETVEESLELATSGTRNELAVDCFQARLIRQTIQRYGNDPQRIETNFERARVSLLEDIAADDLPASAGNRDLIQSLADAAGAIRESDPEIKANREKLNRIRLAAVSTEEGAAIASVVDQLVEVSEGDLKADWIEDRQRLPGVKRDDAIPDPVVPLGAAERNAVLEAQAAQVRVYSRLTKTWLFLREHNVELGVLSGLTGIIGFVITIVQLF